MKTIKKICLLIIILFNLQSYAQGDTSCFSIEPNQIIEVPENAQVGDTIATIQYCSSGEWKKLEAEYFSTLALKENGQLYTWGYNAAGSWPPITAGLDSNQEIIFEPNLVKDPIDNSQDFLLDDVASSLYMAFGIKASDQSLWGWGRDENGSLGIGEFLNAYDNIFRVPQLLNDSNTWKTVSAGNYHGNAIDTEGKLWGWGWCDGAWDQSGFDYTVFTPTQVGSDSDWEVVSCGYSNTFLIKKDGTLWVMGRDIDGSSGLGENPTEEGIVQIGTDSDWRAISSYSTGSIAIKNSGELYVWGQNDGGELGFNPNIIKKIFVPTQIPGSENINFTHADIGSQHGLASDIDGNYYGWGENLSGQLGNGEINTFEEFQLIETGGISTSYVSAAGRTSGFITEGGSMRMFGSNDAGQLGYGEDAVTNPNVPIVVNLGEDLKNATIIKYNSSAIAQGVLTDDGQLWVWGDNQYGRLGVGHADRIAANYYPNRIGESSDVWTDFSHSGQNLYAVKDNKLFAAGQGDHNNIGLGLLNTENQFSMTEVPGVDISEIETWQSSWAGFISIKKNGELWGFGGNWNGQLARNPNTQMQNTMHTVDINNDGFGGINSVDNISEANVSRFSGEYETGQFTTNGQGSNANFLIKINDIGEASVSVIDGGESFKEDDIITVSNYEFGDNRKRSLLTNGNFETQDDSWIIGTNDSSAAPVVTVGNNTYYSFNVLEADEVWKVNVSQKTEILEGDNYTLTFDAWSNTNRSIVAGIGLSSAPYTAATETIALTTEKKTYTLTLDANFGDIGARVLFDIGGEIGEVNIDDVSLINNNVAPDLTFQVDVFGDNVGKSSIPYYQKLNNDSDWHKIYDTKGTNTLIVEKNDGSIWFAGGNNGGPETDLYAALGINDYNNDGLVEVFPVGNDWNTFSSSEGTVIGIKDDGTMWSIGSNSQGRAGLGVDDGWINEITQIGLDSDWKHINLNGPTALAIKTDNTLWTWGSGWTGQLGNGTFGNANQPVLVSGDIQWETTGGGWLFQTAIATDNTIYGWGYNRLGGLGGLGEVSSEYLDWTTDASIIEGAFSLSDLGYVIIQDSDVIDYETISNNQGRSENIMTNSPVEITIPMTMSDGINTSDPEDVIFKIININETPTDIELSEIEFDEDNSIGLEVSQITVNDPDLIDSHSLEIDSQYGDYEKFEIINDKLKLTQTVSFHEFQTLSVKITAADEGGLSYSKIFTVNVKDINDAPVAVNDEYTLSEDSDSTPINVTSNDLDEDDDNLTITSFSSDRTESDISISLDGKQIKYAPEENFYGTEIITYELSDGELTSTATLTISVSAENDAPIAEDGQITIDEEKNGIVTLIASDIDSSELTFSVQDQPNHGSVTIDENIATYKADVSYTGADSFTFTASDGSAESNIATILIDGTLSADIFRLSTIEAYPNPLGNYYIIDSYFPLQLNIYDITGSILNTYSLKEGENRIDTSLLSAGIYLFKYMHKTNTKIQMVIKK